MCTDWKRVKAFSDVSEATSAALSTEFTTAQPQLMSHNQLVDLIGRSGLRAWDLIGPRRFITGTGPVGERGLSGTSTLASCW
jgi:hypothetical protein